MTYCVGHGSADIWDYVRLCVFLERAVCDGSMIGCIVVQTVLTVWFYWYGLVRKFYIQNSVLNFILLVTMCIYTRCPRRNGQNFGRVFLMLKYTDITQNTYVQSWTVTEIKAREKCSLFAVSRTVPGSRDVILIRCALSILVYSWLKRVPHCNCTCKVLGNPKDNYDVSASVFLVQFNGFMSLTSYFDVKYRY